MIVTNTFIYFFLDEPLLGKFRPMARQNWILIDVFIFY